MDAEKTAGMSFRVSPRTKLLLAAAAAHERRSLTNMLEVLVEEFCSRNGIAETATSPATKRARQGGKTK
jgi:hypothetical protein